MEFPSPNESEPSFSVVAQDFGEQDITLSNSNTPRPVLASTAHKDKANRDLLQRIQNLSEMAGSYMETETNRNSDELGDKNFQFLDFLKENTPSPPIQPTSSGSSMDDSKSNSQAGFDSSIGIDLDMMGASASLIHVDSNVSLGSWLGDIAPKRDLELENIGSSDDLDITSDRKGAEYGATASEKTLNSGECSRLASRYFLSQSQLPPSYRDSSSPGVPSLPSSAENSVHDAPVGKHNLDVDFSGTKGASNVSALDNQEREMSSNYNKETEENEDDGGVLNFSGMEFENQMNLQQEFFSSEEFIDDAAEVLNKDEEIFEEENKLLIHSAEELADVTCTGFSAMPDSPFFEHDPKMSIGAYMAARSEKMGRLGEENWGIERPSFGMKIRTPSPRKPFPLLRADAVQDTYIIGENAAGDVQDEGKGTVVESTIENDASHDGTLTENNEKKSDDSTLQHEESHENDHSQDVTIEPSMLSLSEAIMNMSTSVNNEELARAIIELSKKKKQEKMLKKERQRKISENKTPDVSDVKSRTSKASETFDDSKSKRRSSKIPVGTKATSPPKPVRMSYSTRQSTSKDTSDIRLSKGPMEKTAACQQRLSKSGKPEPKPRTSGTTKTVPPGKITPCAGPPTGRTSDSFMRKPERIDQSTMKSGMGPTPLRSVENTTDYPRQKPTQEKKPVGSVTAQVVVVPPQEIVPKPQPLTEMMKSVTAEPEKDGKVTEMQKADFTVPPKDVSDPKSWRAILQESFMQDTPEHDDVVEKSASEQEEMPTFNNGRESVCFPDEVSSKYLLSSTRTDLSLTRGSLSRESIEQLHKKLRVRGPKPANDLPDLVSPQPSCSDLKMSEKPTEKELGFEKENGKLKSDDSACDGKSWKFSAEIDSRPSLQPLSQSSPEGKPSSRYSGEFHQMLPSMSFAEMATIQEHEFDHRDLEDTEECKKNTVSQAAKLEVIQEEAETTQDTIISNQSSASADSQLPSEISQDQLLPHQTQHTMPPHVPLMHHPQQMYPPMQNVMYRHPSQTLPGPYPPEMHYRTMEAPYHIQPEFIGRVPAQIYPHSYSYPISSSFAPHPMLHSTTTPMSYPLEQPSMASSADIVLNHTTNTMYAPGSFHHPGMTHGPRPSSIDGRFHSFPETYFHQQQRRPPSADAIFVPLELVFPGVRCVSLLSHAKLPLVNKSDRWMQVELNIVSPAIDCCFSLESKPLVGPQDTKNIEISFAPKKEGRFEALVEVVSYPVTSEGAMLQSARSTPTMVNVKAVAENACAELQGPDEQHELNFGEILCDTTKYLPLRLINKGSGEVPVCVVLCSKSQDRQCFALSESSSFEWTESEKRTKSILRTVLPPGDRKATVWVHCHIPPKFCDPAEPPKNISAQVYIEIDNAQKQSLDTVLLDSISVEVVACIAKLHAPKSLQPLTFSCPRDSSATHSLPVKNCGNVSSRVSFSFLDHCDVITVSPAHALLAAGELVQLSVRFKPVRFTPNRITSTLLMTIEPNGTKYEVSVVANCTEPVGVRGQGSSLSADPSMSVEEMPTLLTNKSHVCWGGVAVGRSLQQRVVLRTSSGARRPLPMRIMVKGDDASCFQILCEDDREREELCSRREMTMRAGQDKIIRILFGPTKCKMVLAKLEIKAPVDQVPSTKFTIPLSGYGGRSEVKVEELESVPNESDSNVEQFAAYATDIPDKVGDGQRSRMQVKFVVKNNGPRDAFVKAVFYSDKDCQVALVDGVTGCSPSQFVLPKRTTRNVTLTLKKPNPSSENRSGHSRNGRDLMACVCLWHGDEIVRHLLKSALSKLGPSSVNKSLSEGDPLRTVSFDGIFEGEGTNKLEEDLSQVKPQQGDVQVFYTSIRKTVILVYGPHSEKPLFQMVEAGRKKTASSDEQPVKDGHFRRANQSEGKEDETWELSPNHVILSAPRLNSVKDPPTKIKILNRSGSALRFDVAWSGHYLTITPQCGQVDPESVLVLLLNANPSLASRRDLLPWLGTVQVSARDGRGTKQLRVQIRDDVEPLDASVQPATPVPRLPLKAQYSEIPSADSFATPMSASGHSRMGLDGTSKQILLNSTVINFGQVTVKTSAKSHLEFTNVCPSSIRWLLTSFAPAYVKDVEPSGDLYRSTYAAFVFSHTSGLLESGAKVKIPVTFNPMSDGNYSQFWDLEHHEAADSAAMSLNKIRIQLIAQGVKPARLPIQANLGGGKTKESGIYVSEDTVRFPDVPINESTIVKIPVKNRSKDSHSVRFINVRPPFHITHQRHTIRPMSYACLPVTFKPTSKGDFEGTLVIQTEGPNQLTVKLLGKGI